MANHNNPLTHPPGNPFAALVPSSFPSGTDPIVCPVVSIHSISMVALVALSLTRSADAAAGCSGSLDSVKEMMPPLVALSQSSYMQLYEPLRQIISRILYWRFYEFTL